MSVDSEKEIFQWTDFYWLNFFAIIIFPISFDFLMKINFQAIKWNDTSSACRLMDLIS